MEFLTFLTRKIMLLKQADPDNRVARNEVGDVLVSFFSNEGIKSQDLDKNVDYDEIAKALNEAQDDIQEADMNFVLSEFLSLIGNDDIDGFDDSEKDGEISDDEIQAYLKSVMGEDGELTLSDIEEALRTSDIDMQKAIEDFEVNQKEKLKDNTLSENQDSPRAQSSSSSSATNGTSGVGGGTQAPNLNSTRKENEKENYNKYNVAQLQEKKTQEYANLSNAKESIATAQEDSKDYEEKQKNYIDSLNETNDENAKNLALKIQEISAKESLISQTQQTINDCVMNIAQINSNISTMQAQLSQSSSSEENQDGEAVVQLQGQIAQAQEQLQQQETLKAEQETLLNTYNTELNQLNTEKTNLEGNIAPEIMEKISSAKQDYESAKTNYDNKVNEAQKAFSDIQAKIQEIDKVLAAKQSDTNSATVDFNGITYKKEVIEIDGRKCYMFVPEGEEITAISYWIHGRNSEGNESRHLYQGMGGLFDSTNGRNENMATPGMAFIMPQLNYGEIWYSSPDFTNGIIENTIAQAEQYLSTNYGVDSANAKRLLFGYSDGGVAAMNYVSQTNNQAVFDAVAILGANNNNSETQAAYRQIVNSGNMDLASKIFAYDSSNNGLGNLIVQTTQDSSMATQVAAGHGQIPHYVFTLDSDGNGVPDIYEAMFNAAGIKYRA